MGAMCEVQYTVVQVLGWSNMQNTKEDGREWEKIVNGREEIRVGCRVRLKLRQANKYHTHSVAHIKESIRPTFTVPLSLCG